MGGRANPRPAGLNPARREGDRLITDSRRTWLGVMADRSRSRTLLAKSRGAINTEATPCGDSTRLALTAAVFHVCEYYQISGLSILLLLKKQSVKR